MENKIKDIIKNYLLLIKDAFVKNTSSKSNQIKAHFTWEERVKKNKVWYRGDTYELSQFWGNSQSKIDMKTFWYKINTSNKMPGKHYPLPKVLVDTLKKICTLSFNRVEIENEEALNKWEEIAKENDFIKQIYDKAIKVAEITGDGAFAINVDSEFSELPILEVVDGADLQYNLKYGKINSIDRYKDYKKDGKRYVLIEKHFIKKGIVQYCLFDEEGNMVSKELLEETKHLPDEIATPGYQLLIPFKVYDSEEFKGRGESILEGSDTAFDMLDEVLSTLSLAIRKNKSFTAAPAQYDKNGNVIEHNDLDNDITLLPGQKAKNGEDRNATQVALTHINPTFDTIAFENAIRLIIETALIGKMSSVSIGMDTRTHTDPNAAFDKEREKITYHTCNDIQEAFKQPLIELIKNTLYVCRFLGQGSFDLEDEEIQIINDEFAAPSFEQILQITNQAVTAGNMSLYRSIQYQEKDFTEEQIQEEIDRIKEDKNYGMSDSDLFGLNDEMVDDTTQDKDEEEIKDKNKDKNKEKEEEVA